MSWEVDQYVLVKRADATQVLLRQIKVLGKQIVLHAFNPNYSGVSLAERDTILGKVARVRVDL